MLRGMDEFLQLFWVIYAFPILQAILPVLTPILKRVNPNIRAALDFQSDMAAKIDSLLENTELLDGAEHETVYHHLMVPQPGKNVLAMPSRKSLIDEVCMEDMFTLSLRC